MWTLIFLPFVCQALAIGIDEFWFHRLRGLPRWERIGHPIDTFSFFLCIAYLLFVPFSMKAIFPYALLAIVSCILVTKDELVHKEHCSGVENWFHATLFILHPITLAAAGLMWPAAHGVAWIGTLPQEPIVSFLQIQCGALFIFMAYQILFWNIIWKNKPVLKH